MSMMRCEVGDHDFDSDYKDSSTLDKDVVCCEDCLDSEVEK